MNTKQQGDIGVAMAIAYYTKQGFGVSVPLTDNLRYDLIVDDGTRLQRVQVKCTNCQDGAASVLGLRTNGGNQSWNKQSKLITAEETDLILGYDLKKNTLYEFPVEFLAGKSTIRLGPKVDSYKVFL